jgi:dTDP-glucose pyrophosphorylase/CBS domain-containing protein
MTKASGSGSESASERAEQEGRSPIASTSASLLDALRVIDFGAVGICCLTDDQGRLAGVVTDGDVRRAIIAGHDLESSALDHATKNPQTVSAGTPRAHVLDIMRAQRLAAVPEVDEDGRVIRVHSLSEVVGPKSLPNAAVIMAGGKGTRLGSLAQDTPKPLMPVAGRSILEWIILGLVGDGVHHVYVSVNHLADQITDHLGDGSQYGLRIEYLREEEDNPLGTGGALGLIEEPPTDPLLVINGDVLVEFDARELLHFHQATGARVTMGVRQYTHSVPFGVVEKSADDRVERIVEKPELQVTINAAVYCIDPDLIDRVPKGIMSHMPDLVQQCLDANERVMAWPITSDWIDVGTPADLARAKGMA